MTTKQINTYLRSNNAQQIEKALIEVKDNGDSSVIFPLADLLLNSTYKQLHKEVVSIFSSLKDSASAAVMIEVLHSPIHLPIRQIVLSCMWNTGLDYSPYLSDFVQIACHGSWLEALDCLTILENLQGEIQEQHLLESQWHLKEYFDQQGNEEKNNEQKAKILSEIALFLKNADRNIEG